TDGSAPGAADDGGGGARRLDPGSGGVAAALGLSHGYGQSRAVAVHRLAARVQPLDPLRAVWRRRVRLLGFAAPGDGGGVDRTAGLVRRPEAARRGELRVASRRSPRSGSRPAAPRLR